jgi:hypothetical protein
MHLFSHITFRSYKCLVMNDEINISSVSSACILTRHHIDDGGEEREQKKIIVVFFLFSTQYVFMCGER